MNTLMKKLTIAGLSASMMAVSVLPSQAMPLAPAPVAATQSAGTPLVQVQYRDDDRYWRHHDRRWDRRWDRRDDRYERRHHHSSGSKVWVPLAAFAAGALIAGAATSQPRHVAPAAPGIPSGVNPRHFEWCSARYRSYDAYSNTFQPYSGPRQACYSPYY